jgi:predicted fused transcriptional regulator/phosphomethylpyrimidine kinase
MRFDQRIEKAMKELGVSYYRIDRQTIPSELPSDEKTLAGIKEAVDCLGAMPHALVDPGEYGIESVVYLCDSTAMRVAQRANHISQKLVERSTR